MQWLSNAYVSLSSLPPSAKLMRWQSSYCTSPFSPSTTKCCMNQTSSGNHTLLSASIFKVFAPNVSWTRCMLAFWWPTTPPRRISTKASSPIWRISATMSTPIPSRPLFSLKLAGCFIHMNTWTFAISLNFWRTSCVNLTQVPAIALGFQFKNIWDGAKTPKATPFPLQEPPPPPPLHTPSAKLCRLSMLRLPRSMRVLPPPSSTKPCIARPSGA